MSILNSIQTISKQASTSSEDYIEATQDYIELKVFQQISMSFALIIKVFMIGGLMLLGVIFLTVAGILALGKYLGDMNLALLYSALIVFIIGGLIYVFRKNLIDSKVIKKLAKSFFINN